mgnify:CR=1 FL=1
MMKKICFILLLFLICPVATATTLNFTGFIADEADLLTPSVKNDLNMTLWDLQKKSGADIAVVTLPSLNGRKVEDVALEIGRSYKIGAIGKDNGVVFLTAVNEKRMRIELGTGLEKKISIKTLENIRDNDILPYYREGDYNSGIARGTYILAKTVADAEGVNLKTQGFCPPDKSNYDENFPLWVLVFGYFLSSLIPKKHFNTGSFGGFGGSGSFGGSGCSGKW